MTYVSKDSVLAIGTLFVALGTVAVAAWFSARTKRDATLGIDDWLCLLAFVSD